jgi:ATP-dependent Clp protease ATP-binding subunit ClpA
LDLFKTQLAEKNVTLEVSAACVDKLAQDGYSRDFGARNVGRVVEEKIKGFFVDEVLFGRLSSGGGARADYADGEYRVEVISSPEEITSGPLMEASVPEDAEKV